MPHFLYAFVTWQMPRLVAKMTMGARLLSSALLRKVKHSMSSMCTWREKGSRESEQTREGERMVVIAAIEKREDYEKVLALHQQKNTRRPQASPRISLHHAPPPQLHVTSCRPHAARPAQSLGSPALLWHQFCTPSLPQPFFTNPMQSLCRLSMPPCAASPCRTRRRTSSMKSTPGTSSATPWSMYRLTTCMQTTTKMHVTDDDK